MLTDIEHTFDAAQTATSVGMMAAGQVCGAAKLSAIVGVNMEYERAMRPLYANTGAMCSQSLARGQIALKTPVQKLKSSQSLSKVPFWSKRASIARKSLILEVQDAGKT